VYDILQSMRSTAESFRIEVSSHPRIGFSERRYSMGNASRGALCLSAHAKLVKQMHRNRKGRADQFLKLGIP
jgi:hypothetical protein